MLECLFCSVCVYVFVSDKSTENSRLTGMPNYRLYGRSIVSKTSDKLHERVININFYCLFLTTSIILSASNLFSLHRT